MPAPAPAPPPLPPAPEPAVKREHSPPSSPPAPAPKRIRPEPRADTWRPIPRPYTGEWDKLINP